ncbi:MAG: DUF1573 domain-containing protein [Candidatus Schekmanbacteria bacterium]|nr:DUF1573 domain-containing protein [Candidatus Schekmanbacteria bacterium]
MIYIWKNNKFSLLFLMICVFGLASLGYGKEGAIAQFEKEHLDLGQFQPGETPKGYYLLKNVGDETLVIRKIEPSCGCTAAVMKSQEIPPGQSEKIEVSIDTTGKENKIEKTVAITSNDALRPQIILGLTLEVIPAGKHPAFEMGTSLFSERCKSCHVDSGKGLRGKELYQAICYQCHGKNGEGKSAAALNSPEYAKRVSAEYLYKWIAEGEKGTAMAGYSLEHGGFLTKEEIDSLVGFIRNLPEN